MPVLPRGAFVDRLRDRSAADLRALVADVWAARGYDTRTDGDRVVATRGEERLALFPSVGRRLRGPTRPAGDETVDLVVDGGGGAEPVATDLDARYAGPADLYNLLLYGVDREVAADLLHRHLDAPLQVDDATAAAYGDTTPVGGEPAEATSRGGPGSRVRAALGRLRPDGGDAATVVAVGTVVFAAVALGLGPGSFLGVLGLDGSSGGGAGGVTGIGGTGGSGSGATGVGGAGEANASGEPNESNGTNDSGPVGAIDASPTYPPGVDREQGYVDVEALSAAHAEALDGRSYRWVGELDRSGAFGDRDDWDDIRWSEVVETDTRYLTNATGVRVEENGNVVRRSYASYADGEVRYRRVDGGAGPVRYHRTSAEPIGRPQATWAIERYLGGSNASVSRLETREGRFYRVTVADPPPGDEELRRAAEYQATAYVTGEGFVVALRVTYTLSEGEETGRVRYRFEYDRVGEASVDEPPWLDEALRRTAGRQNGGTSGESTSSATAASSGNATTAANVTRTASGAANATTTTN